MKANRKIESLNIPMINNEKIDLRWHWSMINRYKWRLLSLVIIVGLFAALITFSMEPVYRASSSLLIESSAAKFIQIKDVYGSSESSMGYGQYYQTQVQILKSRVLAEDVVSRLKLVTHPEFDPMKTSERTRYFNWKKWLPWQKKEKKTELSDDAKRRSVINNFMGSTSIKPVRNSQIIEVSFDSRDPALAALIVNTITEAYMESILQARLEMMKKASSWLMGRLEGLQKKVGDSERLLQEYRDNEGIVEMTGTGSIAESQLQDITNRLAAARAKSAELEHLYNEIKNSNKTIKELSLHPDVLSKPLVQQLKVSEVSAERKLSELSKRYGYKHPKMIAAKSDLKAVQEKLSKEINNAINGIGKEYQISKANEQQLNNEFEILKKSLQQANRKGFTLKSLEREAQANQQLYELFLTRFKETSVAGNMDAGNARVVDPAIVPTSPVKPEKNKIIMLAMLLALFAGIVVIYLLEILDNTIKTSEEAEEKLGLPVLGMVPLLNKKLSGKNNNVALFTEDNIGTAFAESIRTIRTGVVLSDIDTCHKIILVTSSLPQEGKTTIASNLAVSLGKMERVLLIDADMRSPSIGAEYGFPYNTPGLSELIAGTVEANLCIQRGLHKHDLLLAGIMPPNPLELLSSKRFDTLLKKLSENYDRIIIDSAPIQAVSDSLVLSQKVSAVVYVVHTDETPLPQITTGIKRFREVNAPLAGIVLNKMVMSKDMYYGGYYYSENKIPPIKYEKAS